MQIRMKSGRTVHYRAGEVYSDDRISRHDRDHFVNNGFAERVDAKAIAAAPENKMLNGAPENKANGKGVCPKCGKHVGRGIAFHVKKCAGGRVGVLHEPVHGAPQG